MKSITTIGLALAGLLTYLGAWPLAAATGAFTQQATGITTTNATLNGTAAPDGLATTAWFEWGSIVSYGQTTPPAAVAPANRLRWINAGLSNLIPHQIYHCRLVLSNETGLALGADRPFFTGGTITSWGDNTYLQGAAPANLWDVVAVAGGSDYSLALHSDGTVVAWGGDNSVGQTNVPLDLTNVVALACGSEHSLALRSDGTMAAWGDNCFGETDVPMGLTNVAGVAGGADAYHSLALLNDGTVLAWGDNSFGQTDVPAGLDNAVAVAGGAYHSLALLSDGTVAGWGDNFLGQTDVPAGLSGVAAIAGGGYHSLALLSDGTVRAWGGSALGQTDVPAGLSNVVAVAGGMFFSLALLNDGTVVAWGQDAYGQTDVPAGLSNVGAIAAGVAHCLALNRNRAPVATPRRVVGVTNTDLVIRLSGSDPEGQPLSYRVVALPAAGALYQYAGGVRGAAIAAPNTMVSDPEGRLVFAPVPGEVGDPYASFSFVANDGMLDSAPAVMTVVERTLSALTLTVTSTNDNGAGSLREAMAEAFPGDMINFSVNGVIALTNGELLITKDLAIIGPGPAGLAVSGNTNSRVFEISSNVTVSISGLTVRDGRASNGGSSAYKDGGGIYNAGTLTLTACTVSSNAAGQGGSG